jgi:hypothetical protein
LLVTRSLALAAVFVLGCGSASNSRVCRTSASCSDGEACVTGACANAASPGPVSAMSRRIVVEPEAMTMVLSDDDDIESARPPVAPLGAAVGPRARILLKLPKPTWGQGVQRAWLVLDRVEGASASASEVELRAEKIVEPWSVKGNAGTTWASPPRSESIEGAVVRVSPRGAAPIRIDVTSYANEIAKKGAKTWGLRIEGKGEGFGVPIATGFGKGAAPRLEVYVP